jgi:hypothetical protein
MLRRRNMKPLCLAIENQRNGTILKPCECSDRTLGGFFVRQEHHVSCLSVARFIGLSILLYFLKEHEMVLLLVSITRAIYGKTTQPCRRSSLLVNAAAVLGWHLR